MTQRAAKPHDLDLRKLKKSSPAISEKQWKNLWALVEAFSLSSRAQMLRDLSLRHFVTHPESDVGALVDYSLGDLLLPGLADVLSQHTLDESQVEALQEIFTRLAEGLDNVRDEIAGTPIDLPRSRIFAEQQAKFDSFPRLSSIETVRRLEDLAHRAEVAGTERTLSRKLGEHWDTSVVRDPFLEEMTLREFLTLDLIALLRKRSVNHVKVHLVLRSLETLVEELERQSSGAAKSHGIPVADVPAERQSRVQEREIRDLRLRWLDLEAAQAGMGERGEWELMLVASTRTLSSTVLRAICDVLLPFCDEKEVPTSDLNNALAALSELYTKEFPGILSHARQVLKSILVDERLVFVGFSDDTVGEEARTFLAGCVLLAAGGVPVRMGKKRIPFLWTMRASVKKDLRKILSNGGKSGGKSPIDPKELEHVLPFADAEYVVKSLFSNT